MVLHINITQNVSFPTCMFRIEAGMKLGETEFLIWVHLFSRAANYCIGSALLLEELCELIEYLI